MGGAYLQLINTGVENIHFTHKPDINLFQYKYYKYVNFAIETVKVHLSDSAEFDKRISVKIPKHGHLLSKINLHLTLPKLTKIDGTYASWADTLGYFIFNKPIELLIGGVIVDRIYPVCQDIISELTNNQSRNNAILKSDIYRAAKFNATQTVDMVIPLEFFFTKSQVLALPLLSMTNQDIEINFSFHKFSDVINYDGLIEPAPVSIQNSFITAQYILLDDIILDTLQKLEYKFIIEQMMFQQDSISLNVEDFQSTIYFKKPCKELFFVCIDADNIDNNNYSNYSRRADQTSLISSVNILYNGKFVYNDYIPESFFRQCRYHSYTPNKHIYSIQYSLTPEDATQPTGFINMNRFDDITLALKMTKNNPFSFLHIYGIVHNIAYIKNGELQFEFLNI